MTELRAVHCCGAFDFVSAQKQNQTLRSNEEQRSEETKMESAGRARVYANAD